MVSLFVMPISLNRQIHSLHQKSANSFYRSLFQIGKFILSLTLSNRQIHSQPHSFKSANSFSASVSLSISIHPGSFVHGSFVHGSFVHVSFVHGSFVHGIKTNPEK